MQCFLQNHYRIISVIHCNPGFHEAIFLPEGFALGISFCISQSDRGISKSLEVTETVVYDPGTDTMKKPMNAVCLSG